MMVGMLLLGIAAIIAFAIGAGLKIADRLDIVVGIGSFLAGLWILGQVLNIFGRSGLANLVPVSVLAIVGAWFAGSLVGEPVLGLIGIG